MISMVSIVLALAVTFNAAIPVAPGNPGNHTGSLNIFEKPRLDAFQKILPGEPKFTPENLRLANVFISKFKTASESDTSIIGNTSLFQGRTYDPEVGLYYYRNRYYHPELGRFLQRDPNGYEDSMNLYQAFGMNPVNFVDPFGLLTQDQRNKVGFQVFRLLMAPDAARKKAALGALQAYRAEFGELTREDVSDIFGENDSILNATYVTTQDILNLAGAKIALGMEDLTTNYNIYTRDDFRGFLNEVRGEEALALRWKTEAMIGSYNSVVGNISRMNRIRKASGKLECTAFNTPALNRRFSYIELTPDNYEEILVEQMALEGQTKAWTLALTSAAGNLAVRTNILQRAKFIKRIFDNPDLLKGKMPADLEAIIGKQPGWKIETLGKGSKKGMGWVFREYTLKGDPTGRMIRWHPGGGHHGPGPYWRVTGGPYGKSDIIR